MDVLWSFLIDILRRLLFWVIVQPDEIGVHTRCGRNPRELAPGFHLRWPIIDRVILPNVKEKVVDTRSQVVTTRDGKRYAIGMSLAYEILSPVKAIYENADYENNLASEILRIASRYANHHTAAELQDQDEMAKWVMDELRKIATHRWGIKILRVGVTDGAMTRPLYIMGVSSAPFDSDA